MRNKILFLILITLITFQNTSASQADLDKEVDYYADIFSGDDYKNHKAQFYKLLTSGISSPKVYDHVAEKLKDKINVDYKFDINRASWYVKILGISGNEKYKELLLKFSKKARSSRLRRHARQAVEQLEKHVIRNAIIIKGLSDLPDGNLDKYRLINLMSVHDKDFYRAILRTVKQIYKEKNFDSETLKALAQRADFEMTRQSNINDLHIEVLSWLVKTIGYSGDVSYKPFLEEMLERSKVLKVRKHTKQAIKALKV